MLKRPHESKITDKAPRVTIPIDRNTNAPDLPLVRAGAVY